MNKQPTLTLIESLFSQSKEYVDNRLELYKLKAIDKSSSIASSVISGIALFVVFFIFFVVFNIGIALLIGDLIGKAYLGFLILAAIYAIVGLVLFSKRDKIFKIPIAKMLIGKFL
ncbi:MAG: phage holin family protein [Bacteroidota bacterium]|nr:phage holin family protein [Bacteroidota bacterium]